MKRILLFLLCFLLPVLAACASAPGEIVLEALDEAAEAELPEVWEGTVRIVTRSGPAVPAEIEVPEPSAETRFAGDAGVPDAPEQRYVLNTNSRRFHDPSCPSVDEMKPSNREEYTGSRDALLAMGYTPCGRCKP